MNFSRRLTYFIPIISALFALATSIALASGVTWTDHTATGPLHWYGITSSADGEKLAAVSCGDDADNCDGIGYIYVSTDAGTTWATSTAPAEYWNGIASSADGTRLVAISDQNGDAAPGNIYISTDGGVTWATSTAPTGGWQGITSSANGEDLAAADEYGDPSNAAGTYIYTSTDAGTTWATSTAPQEFWKRITSSADGEDLAATVEFNGDIWTSKDGGATWTDSGAATGEVDFVGISSSADGSKLIADSGFNGDSCVYLSDDGGTTWATSTLPCLSSGAWLEVNSSADGTKLAAVGLSTDVWTSDDGGATWTDQTAASPIGGSNTFITSSADGTKLAVADGDPGDIWTATLTFPPTLTTSAASAKVPPRQPATAASPIRRARILKPSASCTAQRPPTEPRRLRAAISPLAPSAPRFHR